MEILALLIDSKKKTITDVSFEYSTDLAKAKEIIGCECFDIVAWQNDIQFILDDSGLVDHKRKPAFFLPDAFGGVGG